MDALGPTRRRVWAVPLSAFFLAGYCTGIPGSGLDDDRFACLLASDLGDDQGRADVVAVPALWHLFAAQNVVGCRRIP